MVFFRVIREYAIVHQSPLDCTLKIRNICRSLHNLEKPRIWLGVIFSQYGILEYTVKYTYADVTGFKPYIAFNYLITDDAIVWYWNNNQWCYFVNLTFVSKVLVFSDKCDYIVLFVFWNYFNLNGKLSCSITIYLLILFIYYKSETSID